MSSRIPNILLIGAGTFGKKHLKTLLELEKQGVLTLAGVVVRTERSMQALKRKLTVPVYCGVSDELLGQVDAVDIVTLAETHFELVTKCLPKAHVFIEKPLAPSVKESADIKKLANSSPHILMVGHIFRFHPAIMRLKKMVKSEKSRPHSIEATFINPLISDNGRDVQLEMLHPFDIVDYLFNKSVAEKHTEDKGRLHVVSLLYRGGMRAVMKLGWSGEKKERTIRLLYKHQQILCNLETKTITVYQNGLVKNTVDVSGATEALENELRAFIRAVRKPSADYPDADVGNRIVEIAAKRQMVIKTPSSRKKVAVIGAGIFGTNCAIELAPFCNVTVFEKNKSILSEASYINQYRHHWGYHYPRSQETVNDITNAITDFEKRYKSAIITRFPTYYGVAKKNSKVTPEEYLAFCDKNSLPYTLEFPDKQFLDKEKTAICLKTYEPIYNYQKLKDITAGLLKKRKVNVRLGAEIIGARILPDGRKELIIKKGGTIRRETFDYVINVTYARYNNFCAWFNFPRKPIRIDLVEALWVKLNIPKISLAVMDGEFTNMVPTGTDGVFTLVHIKKSILRRFVPKDGLVPKDIFESAKHSRIKQTIEQSAIWFPIVKEAKLLRAQYVLRGVNAYREHDDARTSDITEHGFGCFSILGGKLLNAVLSAKQLSRLIAD
ncbi:MAG: hypothetical protein COW88_00880 [Candidatus Lloydbacteria bacterium CG22_combo_CG10-13_8_21_14_all_47_15]|uniref:FAD dependent oxidoreductase domain-containing protein n=1 Tax=Candidatus Lloydbacteria bacterium CG22_combo_CG10-13_8_21_14_all_47_15 TaxID=1974635 RepID=A0A2H0CV28_9BACT|nr:MAG: hypothetical protein COW88_00880 [Candidatus Lloydbacteria bacterium CG22_combo_CG10-13_8_21_14_all_47_15]